MALECPVCLDFYNLKEKKPKVLGCSHSLCSQCLGTLGKDNSVRCPTCRRMTKLKDTDTNYGLMDVVAEKCEVCVDKVRASKCGHCEQELCEQCLDKHAVIYHGEVKAKVDKLHRELVAAAMRSMEQTLVEQEQEREETAVDQLRNATERRKAKIEKSEADLESIIRKIGEANINSHREWVLNLDGKVDQCKSFVRSARGNLGLKYSSRSSVEDMAALDRKSTSLFSELQHLHSAAPTFTSYEFVESGQSVNATGEIVIHSSEEVDESGYASGDIACTSDGTYVKYGDIKSKAVAGSAGSGADQFQDYASLACVGDRVIVAEEDNARIKVYDSKLSLYSVYRTTLSFKLECPSGICTINEEIFLSGQDIHGIIVLDKYCQLTRTFGTIGSGVHEFRCPMGLAASSAGELYICDGANYRVKVVKSDGRYLRSFGSQGSGPGQFTEWPRRVAVTSEGVVLVTQLYCPTLHMFGDDGKCLRVFDRIETDLASPKIFRGIVLDKNDNILLADCDNHRVIVLNTSGKFLNAFGTHGSRPGELDGPFDITFNSSGDLVVFEKSNHRVQILQIVHE